MGHSADTPNFQKCMVDLNDRRCIENHAKGGSRHVASTECTRMN